MLGFPKVARMMTTDQIEKLIQAGLPDATVEVLDPMNDRTHFEAVVLSPSFAGKTKVQQHKMVYDALGGRMGGVLHALQLSTAMPTS